MEKLSPLNKQYFKMLVVLMGMLVLCRLTNNLILPLMVCAGVWCSLTRKIGWAFIYLVFFLFFIIVNPRLIPKASMWSGFSLRFGPFLIGMALTLVSFSRPGCHRLPLGGLFPFLLIAFVSSMQGWAPQVSYLKMLNFIVFLLGIWFGTQNLQQRPNDLAMLRAFFLALVAVVVLGSICLIPFPSIAYLTTLRYTIAQYGTEYADAFFQDIKASGSHTLFSGLLNHSQALAPILACCFTWTALDMLFIERRFAKFHILLLVCALPLLYMTRSRVALCSLFTALVAVYFYASRKLALPSDMYRRMRHGMMGFLGLIVLAAAVAEIRSGAITEWVRKTNDTAGDTRTLGEAFTNSRQGLINESLRDFKRNIWLGSGFQVAEHVAQLARRSEGFILSAPIEKGLLPLMVLGETGIIGLLFFAGFLLCFFVSCARHHYYATFTLFLVYLATNMGEASFFSPGGQGGIDWALCAIGGFLLDTFSLFNLARNNVEIV